MANNNDIWDAAVGYVEQMFENSVDQHCQKNGLTSQALRAQITGEREKDHANPVIKQFRHFGCYDVRSAREKTAYDDYLQSHPRVKPDILEKAKILLLYVQAGLDVLQNSTKAEGSIDLLEAREKLHVQAQGSKGRNLAAADLAGYNSPAGGPNAFEQDSAIDSK